MKKGDWNFLLEKESGLQIVNVQYRGEDSLRTENEPKTTPLAILPQNVY